jgi:hypothetical protein
VLFGAGVAAASYYADRSARSAPDFAVVPTGLRVVLLGIDGLEAGLADALVARGQMPHLSALRSRAARARLAVEPEQVPAIVWTTIATGRGPDAHGIQSMGGRRLAGMRTPVALGDESAFARALGNASDLLRLSRPQAPSSVLRSVKALWNVASEKGLRVGVVNWWATWPADPVNGYVVTDRAFFKLEKGGAPDREVHPPEAFAVLRALPRPADADRARALDRFHAEAAQALAAPNPPDLEALYLPGLDIATVQQLGEAAASIWPASTRASRSCARTTRSWTGSSEGSWSAWARAGSWCSWPIPAGCRAAGPRHPPGSCCSRAARSGRASSARRASATWPRPCCTCWACRGAASWTGACWTKAWPRRSDRRTRCGPSTRTAAARRAAPRTAASITRCSRSCARSATSAEPGGGEPSAQRGCSAMRTVSPSPFAPRTFFGTASSVDFDLASHHTLVSHETPSTVARTGVRPQP